MEEINLALTTPALLFPAISLLLLAYTNRFLATGQLIRGLSANAREGKVPKASKQIKNLKRRVSLIRHMQIYGVVSLFLCTLSMFLLFLEKNYWGEVLFGISLLAMAFSLFLALAEIAISTHAINYELEGIKKYSKSHEKCKEEEKKEESNEELEETTKEEETTYEK